MKPTPSNELLELIEEFEELDEWDERYELLIDLGKSLPELPAADHIDDNKVEGCMSTVWMTTRFESQNGSGPVLQLAADSDSIMVKGLLAILVAAYKDQPADYVASFDIEGIFERLGLQSNLSPNRRNGLYSMVKRIRAAGLAAS